MNKNTIYKALYVLEVVIGLVVSSTVTILMNVWAFRTLFSINSGYDNIAQRIVAAIIIITTVLLNLDLAQSREMCYNNLRL